MKVVMMGPLVNHLGEVKGGYKATWLVITQISNSFLKLGL